MPTTGEMVQWVAKEADRTFHADPQSLLSGPGGAWGARGDVLVGLFVGFDEQVEVRRLPGERLPGVWHQPIYRRMTAAMVVWADDCPDVDEMRPPVADWVLQDHYFRMGIAGETLSDFPWQPTVTFAVGRYKRTEIASR